MSKRQNNVRGKTKRARRSPTAAIVWLSVLVVLAFGAFELINQFNLWPAQTSAAINDGGDRGTVVLNTEGGRCERMKYDEAGHVIEQYRPCANSDLKLDEHGRPLPTGTVHRLDAIGNSFLGRQ